MKPSLLLRFEEGAPIRHQSDESISTVVDLMAAAVISSTKDLPPPPVLWEEECR